MASSSRSLGWVALGLGIVTLGLVGFGVYSMIHTGNNIDTHKRIVAEKDREILRLAASRRPADRAQATKLDRERYDMQYLLAQYEDDRQMAVFVLIGGVVVLAGFVVCLIFWLRGRSTEDEEEDEDEDERPRRRRRRD